MRIRNLRLLLAGILGSCVLAGAAGPEFTADGQLVRPKDYREWIFLSSGLGMTYGDAGAPQANPQFDNVFVEPSAYRSFIATGRWPDKTILALEIRKSVSKGSINNGGHYQTDVNAVEFAVKDVKRFPNGEWGYFGFRATTATAAVMPPTATCYACHSKNAAVENTFVQFYPTLLEIARAKGTMKASYAESEAQAK